MMSAFLAFIADQKIADSFQVVGQIFPVSGQIPIRPHPLPHRPNECYRFMPPWAAPGNPDEFFSSIRAVTERMASLLRHRGSHCGGTLRAIPGADSRSNRFCLAKQRARSIAVGNPGPASFPFHQPLACSPSQMGATTLSSLHRLLRGNRDLSMVGKNH